MQVKHRRNHFRVWVVLAVVIAIGFLSALILRSPVPVETQHPGAAMEVNPVFAPDVGNYSAALQLNLVVGPGVGSFSVAMGPVPNSASDMTG